MTDSRIAIVATKVQANIYRTLLLRTESGIAGAGPLQNVSSGKTTNNQSLALPHAAHVSCVRASSCCWLHRRHPTRRRAFTRRLMVYSTIVSRIMNAGGGIRILCRAAPLMLPSHSRSLYLAPRPTSKCDRLEQSRACSSTYSVQ